MSGSSVASWSAYRFLRRQEWWSGVPIFWRIFHSLLWSTQSKGSHVVNEACVFLESLAFSTTQWMLAIWSLVPLSFLNTACTSGSFLFTYCWSIAWRILNIILLACEIVQLCGSLSILWHCLSLGLRWKLTFPICWVFRICWHSECSTKCGPLEKGMANHFSILALRTPWTVKFNYPYLNKTVKILSLLPLIRVYLSLILRIT